MIFKFPVTKAHYYIYRRIFLATFLHCFCLVYNYGPMFFLLMVPKTTCFFCIFYILLLVLPRKEKFELVQSKYNLIASCTWEIFKVPLYCAVLWFEGICKRFIKQICKPLKKELEFKCRLSRDNRASVERIQ